MGDARFLSDIEGAAGLTGQGAGADTLRGLLNFAPSMEMVPPDTLEKSGIQKGALIVREN